MVKRVKKSFITLVPVEFLIQDPELELFHLLDHVLVWQGHKHFLVVTAVAEK
jgi:hypothetical protein